MTQKGVTAFDQFLENAAREQMNTEGRRIVRWMGSNLNETTKAKALVTGYIAEDQGRERRHFDVRLPIAGRKFYLSGCFDVARADELARPIMTSLREIVLLDRNLH